ncbi:MAG: helix-hairpin-helix domain-containing protein, partial [Candidatus Latescibacterota bacterium]
MRWQPGKTQHLEGADPTSPTVPSSLSLDGYPLFPLRFLLSLSILLCGVFPIFPVPTFGQEEEIEEEALDPEAGWVLQDWLADLEANPLDVNQAPAAVLGALPGLLADQADRIVSWRILHGPFRSVAELSKIEGLDEDTVARLARYLACPQPLAEIRRFAVGPPKLQSRVRLWCPDGGESLPPLAEWTAYSRILLSAGEALRVGVVTEKDPGETNAFDFVAGYAELRDRLGFDQIVLGDFRPEFGQGLLFSRSSRAMDGLGFARKRPTQAVGYQSSTETGALRGLFLRRRLGAFEGVLFGARTRSDATLGRSGEVTGFSFVGRHVTQAEKARKDALTEGLVAARLQWHRTAQGRPGERTQVGLTLAHARFSPSLARRDPERDHFAFIGSRITHLSLDWDLFLLGLNGFGEVVCSPQGGNGLVAGWVRRDGPFILESLIRAYDPRFRSFHGSGFAASASENGNEIGAFNSMVWRIRSGSQLALYYDQHRTPWRSYLTVLPNEGARWGAELRHRLSGSFETLVRVRRSHGQTTPSIDGEYTLTDWHRSELRWEGQWRSGSRFRLKSRVEHILAGEERGSLLFGDLRVNPRKRWVL